MLAFRITAYSPLPSAFRLILSIMSKQLVKLRKMQKRKKYLKIFTELGIGFYKDNLLAEEKSFLPF